MHFSGSACHKLLIEPFNPALPHCTLGSLAPQDRQSRVTPELTWQENEMLLFTSGGLGLTLGLWIFWQTQLPV